MATRRGSSVTHSSRTSIASSASATRPRSVSLPRAVGVRLHLLLHRLPLPPNPPLPLLLLVLRRLPLVRSLQLLSCLLRGRTARTTVVADCRTGDASSSSGTAAGPGTNSVPTTATISGSGSGVLPFPGLPTATDDGSGSSSSPAGATGAAPTLSAPSVFAVLFSSVLAAFLFRVFRVER